MRKTMLLFRGHAADLLSAQSEFLSCFGPNYRCKAERLSGNRFVRRLAGIAD